MVSTECIIAFANHLSWTVYIPPTFQRRFGDTVRLVITLSLTLVFQTLLIRIWASQVAHW